MAARSGARGDEATVSREWWISLNVTRTRVSLLGFNLTVVAFLVGLLLTVHEGQAFTHHLPAMSSLFLAFCLSIVAAGSLLTSQELDAQGLSRPWLFSVGDICMYVALSQSIAGLTRRYLASIEQAVASVQAAHPADAGVGGFVLDALMLLALIAWALTIYVGPCISIARSPLRRRERIALSGVYLGLLLLVFAVATEAHELQDVVLDERESELTIFLRQFLQPLTW